MAVNDKLEVKAYHQLGDQIGINVRHFIITNETGGGNTRTELLDGLSSQYSGLIKPAMASAAKYVGMTLQDFTTLPPPAAAQSTVGAGSASVSGDVLPSQVSGIIHLQSVLAGRHGRGRVYVPFAAESLSGTDGNPNLTYVGVLVSLAHFWLGPVTVTVGGGSTTVQGAIRNRVTNVFTQLLKVKADDRWATQRRRGAFGRQNPIPF